MGVYRSDDSGVDETINSAALRLNAVVIDALTANIAVIGADGNIIATNRAWNRFAQANGAPPERGNYLQFNYLDICDQAEAQGDEHAARAGRGIRAVSQGDIDCYTGEYRCDSPEVRRWFLLRATPARDGCGSVVVAHEDITDRKSAEEAMAAYSGHLEEMVAERTRELQETQEELVRKERLATLGQFAGSVGHELRNPLAVMSNAIYYLQAVIQNPDETTREYLEIIAKEVRISEKIICDLLEMSRNRPAEKGLFSVCELVSDAILHQSSWEGVEVSANLPESLPEVYVDFRQIVQVIDNLIANALQAMPDGGRLELAARQDGETVLLTVSDTGTGMPGELIEKVFDPLVTTKRGGIGLGLTVSKRLAELNGARLEVESEEGKGSCFTIVLPARL